MCTHIRTIPLISSHGWWSDFGHSNRKFTPSAQTCGCTGWVNAITRGPLLPWSARYTAAPKGCKLHLSFLTRFAVLHAAVHAPVGFCCTSWQTHDSEGVGNICVAWEIQLAETSETCSHLRGAVGLGEHETGLWVAAWSQTRGRFVTWHVCQNPTLPVGSNCISLYQFLSSITTLIHVFCVLSSLNAVHHLDMWRSARLCTFSSQPSSSIICRPAKLQGIGILWCCAKGSIDFRSLAPPAWGQNTSFKPLFSRISTDQLGL